MGPLPLFDIDVLLIERGTLLLRKSSDLVIASSTSPFARIVVGGMILSLDKAISCPCSSTLSLSVVIFASELKSS
jgi:hypothetical protein